MNNTVIDFESIVIGFGIKRWHFDNSITNNSVIQIPSGWFEIPLMITFTFADDLETIEKVLKQVFVLTFMLQGFIRNRILHILLFTNHVAFLYVQSQVLGS